ncbi:MAG: glycosyltransferase family 4 protein [Nitrospirales bacterium]
MKILLCSEVSATRVIGGAERVLREQALGLRERGYEVEIVARGPAGDTRPAVHLGDAQVGHMTERRYPVNREHELAFVLSSLLRSVDAFDAAFDGHRPDVALIHQSLAGLGPILRRRRAVRSWIYMCLSLAHEEYLTRCTPGGTPLARSRWILNAKVRRWTERLVMRRCDRVVVLSEFMRRRVIDCHRVPESKVHLVPGAADMVQFHPPRNSREVRQELKLPFNKTVLFTVRNLVPRMGLDNLLQAIAALGEEERDLLLLIGGEGPLVPVLQRSILELGLTRRVQLLGFIPEDLLAKYYQAADLVVMPTHQLEGFGLVTVEALACGTPVLGTPVGAIPEVLSGIDPALVTEGTDSHALARGIRHLLRRFRDQPGEKDRLAARGRALIEREYTWRRHVESLDSILRDTCAMQQARPPEGKGV